MEVKIREATLKDIEVLDNLQNKLGQYEKNFHPFIKKKGRIMYHTLKDLRELIKSKNALVLLAEINEKVIGSGFCRILKNTADWSVYSKRAIIRQVFVEEKYRRRDIGKRIIDKLVDWLHKRKIYDIRVMVLSENSNALKAYHKYGFKEYVFEMNYPLK